MLGTCRALRCAALRASPALAAWSSAAHCTRAAFGSLSSALRRSSLLRSVSSTLESTLDLFFEPTLADGTQPIARAPKGKVATYSCTSCALATFPLCPGSCDAVVSSLVKLFRTLSGAQRIPATSHGIVCYIDSGVPKGDQKATAHAHESLGIVQLFVAGTARLASEGAGEASKHAQKLHRIR